MANANGISLEAPVNERQSSPKSSRPAPTETATPKAAAPAAPKAAAAETLDPDQIDDVFKELKTLLGAVEKLQKARQEVGDIKPLIVRLLDGELLAGEELEQLKSGVNGLSKLVRFYGDYQEALAKAQPARELLDQAIKS